MTGLRAMTALVIALSLGCGPGAEPEPTDAPRQAGLTPPGPVLEAELDREYMPKPEMRGIWVTRWTWTTEDEVRSILDAIADAGFNAVFFQVRGTADAYYRSGLEPWAARLSGKLGQDPGWDPLAVAVEHGRSRGLEIHAYLNTFPLWRGLTPPGPSTPPHPLDAYPDWRLRDASGQPTPLKDGGYLFASPGDPRVRAWVAAVAADIDQRYDVDGIHLDYIRYPGRSYQDAAGPKTPAWRREQINLTVAGVAAAVETPVTAAVWGVYENSWGWPGTSQGLHEYDQDSRAMLAQGHADATIPMIYWPVTDPPGGTRDFRTLAEDHLAHASGRHVYTGLEARYGLDVAISCVEAARELGAPGFVLFDYSQAEDWLADFGAAALGAPVDTPDMPWRE